MEKFRPSCPAGNGECPVECPIFYAAIDAMPTIAEEPDPYMTRLSLLFADASNQDVRVGDIAQVLSRCVQETGIDYLQELRKTLDK